MYSAMYHYEGDYPYLPREIKDGIGLILNSNPNKIEAVAERSERRTAHVVVTSSPVQIGDHYILFHSYECAAAVFSRTKRVHYIVEGVHTDTVPIAEAKKFMEQATLFMRFGASSLGSR